MYHLAHQFLMRSEIDFLPHGMFRSDAHSPDERKKEETYLCVIEIRIHPLILKSLNTDLRSAKQHITHVFFVSTQLLLATLTKKIFRNSLLERSASDEFA